MARELRGWSQSRRQFIFIAYLYSRYYRFANFMPLLITALLCSSAIEAE
jgi:hypothetical protein